MKRFLFLLAFFAGLAVALALVRTEVSTNAAAQRIAEVLVPFGDRQADIAGEETVRLFPRLAVVFKGVRIAASRDATLAKPDLTADSIVADIDLLPLLIGQTSVSNLVLDHPDLRVQTTFDLAGFVPERTSLRRMQPASVIVHHGAIRFVSPDLMREETLGDIEATLRWPRALGNLSLDGMADWRGERIGLSLQGIAPPRLGAGEPGDIDMTLDAPSFRMNFAGQARLSDRLQLDGVFSASADDPHRVSDLLFAVDPHVENTPLPPVDVHGHLRSQGWLVTISDAHVDFGTLGADGVLSARIDLDRPQLRGTLAIGDVDLTPALTVISKGGWLRRAPDSATLAAMDIDLRLSVGEALIGATRVSNVAASLLVADGQIHGEIGDATLLGGTGSMLVHGTLTPAGLSAAGRYGLKDASATAVRSALSLTSLPRLSGAISLSGDFQSSGQTLDRALRHVRGHTTCDAAQLAADELAPAAVAFMASPSPIMQQASIKLGLNPTIDHFTCAMTFAGAELAFRHINFQLAGLKFDLGGTASIDHRTIGLTGNAQPDATITSAGLPTDRPEGAAPPAPIPMQVPISVSGTLDHPIVKLAADVPVDPEAATGAVPEPATPN